MEPTSEPPRALDASDQQVGAFTQGTPFSRWALARYLVGQAVARSVSDYLLVVVLAAVALAVATQVWLHLTVLTVLLALVALGALGLRGLVRLVLRRLTHARQYAPLADRLDRLVADTGSDVRRELRRLGLPSHTVTMPLLAVRLVGRRRAGTIAALRGFDTARVMPAARLDELHLLLRSGGPGVGR